MWWDHGINGLRRKGPCPWGRFTPHTWGNGIQLLANAHLLAATFPEAYLEYPLDPPEWTETSRDFLQDKPVVPINGFMSVETGPGLGFSLAEHTLECRSLHAVGTQ